MRICLSRHIQVRLKVDTTYGSISAPAELGGDELQDAADRVGVVLHAQLVRDGQEQRVGGGDGLVRGELFDQHIGLGGVRAAEDRTGIRVDEADLVLVAGVAA